MESTHLHPNMRMHRLIHYLISGVLVLLIISVPLQVLLAITISGGFMFIITGFLTLMLGLPLILLLFSTPPVTFTADGFKLHPTVGSSQFVLWDDVKLAKEYPLLPSEDTETVRRLFVGRRKYRPAQGIMVIVPKLPLPYRVVGFFAGTGGQPVVAFTNRSHTDYERIEETISRNCPVETAQSE